MKKENHIEHKPEQEAQEPTPGFKSKFKTWMKVISVVILLTFCPEQIAWAIQYDSGVLSQKPTFALSQQSLASGTEIADSVRKTLLQLSKKPYQEIRLSDNLSITLDKPLDISRDRIEEIHDWLRGRPCGTKALWDFLNYKGIYVRDGDIAALALTIDILNDLVEPEGDPEVIETSFYSLQQAAQYFGIDLYPIKLNVLGARSGVQGDPSTKHLAPGTKDVLGARSRVLGSREDGDSDGVLFRETEGLAGRNEFSNENLRVNESIPQRGELWDDISNSQSSSINTSEHSRGPGQISQEGVHTLPLHRQGVSLRSDNTVENVSEAELSAGETNGTNIGVMQSGGEQVKRFDKRNEVKDEISVVSNNLAPSTWHQALMVPFIAHFKDNHYVLVTQITSEKVYYIERQATDNPTGETFLPLDLFQKKLSGYFLTEDISNLEDQASFVSEDETKAIFGSKYRVRGNKRFRIRPNIDWTDMWMGFGFQMAMTVAGAAGGANSFASGLVNFGTSMAMSQITQSLTYVAHTKWGMDPMAAQVFGMVAAQGLNYGFQTFGAGLDGVDAPLGEVFKNFKGQHWYSKFGAGMARGSNRFMQGFAQGALETLPEAGALVAMQKLMEDMDMPAAIKNNVAGLVAGTVGNWAGQMLSESVGFTHDRSYSISDRKFAKELKKQGIDVKFKDGKFTFKMSGEQYAALNKMSTGVHGLKVTSLLEEGYDLHKSGDSYEFTTNETSLVFDVARIINPGITKKIGSKGNYLSFNKDRQNPVTKNYNSSVVKDRGWEAYMASSLKNSWKALKFEAFNPAVRNYLLQEGLATGAELILANVANKDLNRYSAVLGRSFVAIPLSTLPSMRGRGNTWFGGDKKDKWYHSLLNTTINTAVSAGASYGVQRLIESYDDDMADRYAISMSFGHLMGAAVGIGLLEGAWRGLKNIHIKDNIKEATGMYLEASKKGDGRHVRNIVRDAGGNVHTIDVDLPFFRTALQSAWGKTADTFLSLSINVLTFGGTHPNTPLNFIDYKNTESFRKTQYKMKIWEFAGVTDFWLRAEYYKETLGDDWKEKLAEQRQGLFPEFKDLYGSYLSSVAHQQTTELLADYAHMKWAQVQHPEGNRWFMSTLRDIIGVGSLGMLGMSKRTRSILENKNGKLAKVAKLFAKPNVATVRDVIGIGSLGMLGMSKRAHNFFEGKDGKLGKLGKWFSKPIFGKGTLTHAITHKKNDKLNFFGNRLRDMGLIPSFAFTMVTGMSLGMGGSDKATKWFMKKLGIDNLKSVKGEFWRNTARKILGHAGSEAGISKFSWLNKRTNDAWTKPFERKTFLQRVSNDWLHWDADPVKILKLRKKVLSKEAFKHAKETGATINGVKITEAITFPEFQKLAFNEHKQEFKDAGAIDIVTEAGHLLTDSWDNILAKIKDSDEPTMYYMDGIEKAQETGEIYVVEEPWQAFALMPFDSRTPALKTLDSVLKTQYALIHASIQSGLDGETTYSGVTELAPGIFVTADHSVNKGDDNAGVFWLKPIFNDLNDKKALRTVPYINDEREKGAHDASILIAEPFLLGDYSSIETNAGEALSIVRVAKESAPGDIVLRTDVTLPGRIQVYGTTPILSKPILRVADTSREPQTKKSKFTQ